MIHSARKNISFFGLGSATAAPLLYTYIAEHPEAFLPTSENTNFFSDTTVYKKGRGWYEAQFENLGAGGRAGELALNYLNSGISAGLIARTYPEAKLLAVIENPLVSVRVEYVKARRSKQIPPGLTLAQFLKQYPAVLERARYARQLLPYFNYYSHNDLLVLTASEVRDRPLEVVKQVYEHLGLNASFVPSMLRHLVIVEEEPGQRKPGLIRRTFRFIKKLLVVSFTRLLHHWRPVEVPIETASNVARSLPLSPELEQFLKNYYRADVATLSDLLNRGLSAEWEIE